MLCFSHLRWNFVYQRPQHLLTRFNAQGEVHFWEEPLLQDREAPLLQRELSAEGVRVLTPLLPHGLSAEQAVAAQRALLDAYLAEARLRSFVAWYYTPMALAFSAHLTPDVTVYDCMDELSAFQGAPPALLEMEQRLFAVADVVFAGGASLYASKKKQHANVHLFASSIDRDHFATARHTKQDPADQQHIAHPRVGFFGVLDERLDRVLLQETATLRPEWQFVLVGPVVKIREDELPRAANIHYLGQKSYADLPQYLANWDVAMLPFAQNASTRFISPTKTPEYLAAGKPVVSTPIRDVVKPYGDLNLVRIVATPEQFAEALDVARAAADNLWLSAVDKFLAGTSWDKTFEGMQREIARCYEDGAAGTAVAVKTESVLHV